MTQKDSASDQAQAPEPTAKPSGEPAVQPSGESAVQPSGVAKADAAERKHKQRDTPEQRQAAHAWLDQVAEEFGLSRTLHRAVAKDLLDLTRRVAYERSRPAAPLTLFLLGIAAGRSAGDAEFEPVVREKLDALIAELDNNPQ